MPCPVAAYAGPFASSSRTTPFPPLVRMSRLVLRLPLLLGILLFLLSPGRTPAGESAAAGLLAVVNGQPLTTQDFRDWWRHYREDGMAFPETPDPFIDWHLLVQEALRMELDRTPTFQRKVEVFLRARAMMLLKAEAVDSRIHLDEEEVAVEVARRLVGRPSPPTAAERQRLEREVRHRLWKREEDRLTRELVARLRQKYRVRIDEELLARLDARTTAPDLLDRPLVFTADGAYPAGIVVGRLANEQRLRTKRPLSPEALERLKRRIVESLVTDIVLRREALARHYEKRPPFEATYTFYRQHRLIKELEGRLLTDADTAIDEKAILEYYRTHQEEFRHPGMIRYALVTGSAAQVRQVWLRVLAGTPFESAARTIIGTSPQGDAGQPDLLPAPLAAALDRLTPGEVSRPFPFGDRTALVQLLDRKAAEAMPLAAVRTRIRTVLLRQRRQQRRQRLLAMLAQRSRIEVYPETWQRLRRELASATPP